jgi:hypothetical protein
MHRPEFSLDRSHRFHRMFRPKSQPESRVSTAAMRQKDHEMDTATLEAVWRGHQAEWSTLYEALKVELGERFREGYLAHNDDQRARVKAVSAALDASYAAYQLSLPPAPPEPDEPDLLENFLQRRQWEREITIPVDDLVPIDARLAVPFSADTAESLIRHMRDTMPRIKADSLAWDLRRLLGDEGGLDQYDVARWILDEDEDEEAPARLWPTFDRPRDPGDMLLIDLADEATHREWTAPDDIAAAIEQMRNIADASPVRRATKEAIAEVVKEKREQEEWRREQYALKGAALAEWRAFDGKATQQQVDAFHIKFAKFTLWNMEFEPVKIVAPPMPLPEHPNLTAGQAASLEDFYAYLPQHTYIFTPTREMWPASSVNSRIPPVAVPMREKPIPAATWLDANRAVEQMTRAPGKPMEIRDRLIADGGWINRPGCTTFNLYRPPALKPVAGDVTPWLNHVRYVFGDDADHIINWLAHRVQFPDQKINHALVLGGPQGIGKDTMIEPVKAAVGPWNCSEVSPQQMLGRFNGFVKSVILRISEARDLGDTDRYGFYEHMKTLTAAPPDVLRVDEKHMREHAVLNVCGVIITTNNKDSLHLPSDDRRHFVAWSLRKKDDFLPDYWTAVYRWFASGGNEIVAHYLADLDLSGFDAKAPPPKTQAFWEIVDSSRAPEDAEMADAMISKQDRTEHFDVKHLERLPLGMSYPEQVQRVGMLLQRPPLDAGCKLVIDETGVGRAVGDIFDAAGLWPNRVTITAGQEATQQSGKRWHVAKGILISGIDARLHTGELKIAAALSDAGALQEELKDFQRKVSEAGRATYNARVGAHDDLILAVAIALWFAKNMPSFEREELRI